MKRSGELGLAIGSDLNRKRVDLGEGPPVSGEQIIKGTIFAAAGTGNRATMWRFKVSQASAVAGTDVLIFRIPGAMYDQI